MNDSAQRYLSDADTPSLTPEERSTIRFALQAKMAVGLTAEEKVDVRRALQHVVYAEPAAVSTWAWLRMPLRLSASVFSIVFLLGVSGGTLAVAAEGAIPGDALYGVKIYVNEALRTKLQFSSAERAHWAVTRLQRRMDEMKRLQARGIAEAEIDVAIADHVESVAHDVEIEVESLPAAAAERAAIRTAVNAAIGTDQDSLRRASRVNRVLKALKERADRFDAPTPAVIAPLPAGQAGVPSVNARPRNEVQVKIKRPGNDADADTNDAAVEVDAESDIEVDVPDALVPKML